MLVGTGMSFIYDAHIFLIVMQGVSDVSTSRLRRYVAVGLNDGNVNITRSMDLLISP